MISHSISSGGTNVVATGSVFSFNMEPIEISVVGNTIVFDFKSETNKIEFKPESNTKIVIEVGHIINGGTSKPVALGENERSVLYLMFQITRPAEDVRHLNYTLFAEPKKKVMKSRGKSSNSKKDD